MKDNNKQVCNLCSNHCSTDKLQCNRGIRYFNHPMDDHPLDEERVGRNMSDNYEKNMNDISASEISTNESNDINTNEISSNDIQKGIHERHHHEGGHEHRHRNKNHGGKCKQHGGFGRIGYDSENDDDLLSLLAKSSHILHHQKGGKRGQGKILRILATYQEINQKELQEILNIESGSMSELVIKLEHKGLITRTKDETDRRMTKLKITELGLELSKEIETSVLEDNKLLYGSLSEQEQEELKVLLKKLLQGYEEHFELLHEQRNGLKDGNLFDKGEHSHINGSNHHHKGGKRHGGNNH